MENIKNNDNKKDKLFKSVLIVFIVIIFAFSALVMYYRSQNKIVSMFGYSVCYVLTGSMEPYLEVGDVLLIKDEAQEEIEVDDIITFVSVSGPLAGNFVTHRVVEVLDEGEMYYYRTKGDANPAVDAEIVGYNQIEGVFDKKLTIAKTIMSVISNPFIFIMLVIIPLLVSLIMQFVNFVTETNSKEKSD